MEKETWPKVMTPVAVINLAIREVMQQTWRYEVTNGSILTRLFEHNYFDKRDNEFA